MNIMGTGWDVEASARGTMPFICSCIFFRFSRFSPAIVSAKINFLSRSQSVPSSVNYETGKRLLSSSRNANCCGKLCKRLWIGAAKVKDEAFQFQSMWKSINWMQKQATRREFAMRRSTFGFVSSQLALEVFMNSWSKSFPEMLLEWIHIGLNKLAFLLLLSQEKWEPAFESELWDISRDRKIF